MEQITFFASSDRLSKLSKIEDPLEKLSKYVNWSIFEEPLKEIFYKDNKGLGVRPAYDYLLMFKVVILQQTYNLSDDRLEYQINDRLSFQRFLGLSINSMVPDAKTICLFKEEITKKEQAVRLFERFHEELKQVGLITQVRQVS
jgi:transposase